MKNILTYYFKKRLPLFIVVLTISMITTIVYLVSSRLVSRNYNEVLYIKDTGMIYLSVLLLIFTTFYSIFEFSFKMKRTSCDLFYSLPIKRRSLFISKYIVGISQILIIFIVNFVIVLIFGIASFAGKEFYNQYTSTYYSYNFGYYFMYLGIMISVAILLYSWYVFFFTRCNTLIDGLINMALSSTLLCVISIAISEFIIKVSSLNYSDLSQYLVGSDYIPYVSMFIITIKINSLAINSTNYVPNILPLVITWGLCAASLVLFIILSDKERAENTLDISDSYFSYKVFLPIMIISLLSICDLSDPLFVAVFIGGYIGFVIYNKHFKLRKNDWFIYIISSGVGFILLLVGALL